MTTHGKNIDPFTELELEIAEFMKAVAVAIDLGRENGIDADFVNPLTVLMKSLSENAITHIKDKIYG